jgi:hypothetical protein
MAKAFNGHGLSDSHTVMRYNLAQVSSKMNRASRRVGKNNGNRNRKAEFENQAKLMEYDANLKDWHNTRAPGHAAAMMSQMREAGTYRDDDNNVLGNISGSWKGAEGTGGSIGGWKNAKRAKAEEPEQTEDNPNGQGQQMKQFAGRRKVFLGVYKEPGDEKGKEYPLANIPTLTSENSTTDKDGRIATVGWTSRNPETNKFESNVENKDAYENQQDRQDQQADEFHNRGQQMRLF